MIMQSYIIRKMDRDVGIEYMVRLISLEMEIKLTVLMDFFIEKMVRHATSSLDKKNGGLKENILIVKVKKSSREY